MALLTPSSTTVTIARHGIAAIDARDAILASLTLSNVSAALPSDRVRTLFPVQVSHPELSPAQGLRPEARPRGRRLSAVDLHIERETNKWS